MGTETTSPRERLKAVEQSLRMQRWMTAITSAIAVSAVLMAVMLTERTSISTQVNETPETHVTAKRVDDPLPEQPRDETSGELQQLTRRLVEAEAVARGKRPVFALGRTACREWFEQKLNLEFRDGLQPDNILANNGEATSVLIFGDEEFTNQIVVIGSFSGQYAGDTAELLVTAAELLSPGFNLVPFLEQATKVTTGDAQVSTSNELVEITVGTSDVSDPPTRITSFACAWKITKP